MGVKTTHRAAPSRPGLRALGTGGAIVGALTLLVSAASAQPELHVEPAVLELGVILQHQVLQEELLIMNRGTEPLVIDEVGRTCVDCLDPLLPQQVLAPGEAISLTVNVLPGDRTGALDEMVVLETRHPNIGNHGVRVRADVVPTYSLAGAPFLVEVREASERPSRRVQVTPNFPMQGHLVTFRSTSALFDVALREDPRYPGSYLADVQVVADLPVGMTHAILDLESSHPEDPLCHVHVSVFLPPPVHVYPSRLRVAPTDREQLRILFMDQRTPEPVELLDVQVPGPEVTWRYFRGFGLERSRLNVYIDNQKGVEGYIGDIVLVTDYGESPEFKVPLFVDPNVPAALGPSRWPSVAAGRAGCGCNVQR